MINRRLLAAWKAAPAMLCIAGASLATNKQTIEPDCALGGFTSPGPFAKNDRFVSGQVVIPRGNATLTGRVLEDTRLKRLTCTDGPEACVYKYPPTCGMPEAVARKLTANIFACRGKNEQEPPASPAPIAVGNVFPHAIIRLPSFHGESKKLKPSDTSSDPYFEMHQTSLKALMAEQAWKAVDEYGWTNTISAVIDDGVDLDHPELERQLDMGVEIPCLRGLCDGRNAKGKHGTSMAGIIAATRHNGWMIGTAWNTRILPIRISAEGQFTFDVAAAAAVRCAKRRGAKVMNFSLGGDVPTPLLVDALMTATGNWLFVVSAGNSGESLQSRPDYPAYYNINRMMVVMSHDINGRRELSSAWGTNVDLAAPGYAMYPKPCRTSAIEKCFGFARDSTSNATAFVSGAAALLWSVYDEWSYTDIKWRILETADEEPNLRPYMNVPRRLNLGRMMYPVAFQSADNNQRIRAVTLQSIDLSTKPLPAELDLSKAFPKGMCDSMNVELVRSNTAPPESLKSAEVKKGDAVQFLATCLRVRGKPYTARSVTYEVID